MWRGGFFLLIGVFYTYTEIMQSQDIYVAELMVETNVTLEAKTILDILTEIKTLEVNDKDGKKHTVTFLKAESVAECLIVGTETSCNCSIGFIWSNEVCKNYNCCRETPCAQNVSFITSLCIPKVPVYINGTVTLSSGDWTEDMSNKLTAKFEELNGFESLNVTKRIDNVLVADFEVGLSVKFDTSELQEKINTLQTVLMAYIIVDTTGMVYIEYPGKKVCYHSTPILQCTFEHPTDKSDWYIIKTHERFELNDGSVVNINQGCSTTEFQSCVGVTLNKVTGAWEGTYECGFTKGSVRHTANSYLSVARLPDKILLTTDPITGDCSKNQNTGSINVKVTTTIPKTNNTYVFDWKYNSKKGSATPVGAGKDFNYVFNVPLSCVKVSKAQTISVNFTNDIQQKKSASVTIPVIYEGQKFCEEEKLNTDVWPKTPSEDTAIIRTCPEGRTGFRSRTCKNTAWGEVFDSCVNEKLNAISNAAEIFLEGMGATEDVALNIFSDLDVNTGSSSGDTDNIADLSASVNVLGLMAQASENVSLTEKVLPTMVSAASNMLNKTWDNGINETVLYDMSSQYLESLEGLVYNIGVNTSSNSSNFNSPNIDLKYCLGKNCTVEVFGIGVKVNKPKGLMKTVAVKNLMHKLRNTFKNTKRTDLLMSTTLESNSDRNVQIEIAFPVTVGEKDKPYCVFWNTDKDDFDDKGCKVKKSANGNSSEVACICNHLTSFSVLMARGDVSNPALDMITYVGLGVSVASLVIFLIIEYLVWGAVVKSKLSHYRHTAMVNIALFLLLANICFLATIEPSKLSESTCLALTLCKHLFFLAKFCWMLCLSGMLVHQLIFVFSPLRKKVFMYFSSIVGYIVPILIVGSTYVYYKYTNKPYYNPDLCWLTYDRLLEGSLHAFLLPIGAVLLSNIFSLGVVIATLLKSSKNDGQADEKETAKSIIKVILVLAPVFGVTWSIGFCLVIFNTSHPAYEFFNYTFTIVNSFQGFFVLLTGFVAEQKVKDELYKIITGNKKGSSDSTKNLTSTMTTKDK